MTTLKYANFSLYPKVYFLQLLLHFVEFDGCYGAVHCRLHTLVDLFENLPPDSA